MDKVRTYWFEGYLLCWTMVFCLGCQSGEHGGLERAARMPLTPEVPAGAAFDYLLYDNDFNAVPVDADPERYVLSVLDSPAVGMVYHLTKTQEFSPGVEARIGGVWGKAWYRISLRALQNAEDIAPALQRGFVVVSLERGDSIIEYQPYSIDEWLQQYQRHVVDKWEELTIWHPVPDAQVGDLLKVYVWNPEGGDLYIDDFRVERWRPAPTYEQTYQKNKVLLSQSYEGEGWGPQHNQEQAYRGIGAAMLTSRAGGVAYGSGYQATLAEAGIHAGMMLKVQFAALKQHGVRQADQAARMVLVLERNSTSIHWQGWAIDPRIWKEGEQTVNEWTVLTWWVPIPADARSTDVLKIYPWNNTEHRIFIDDLEMEVWAPTE